LVIIATPRKNAIWFPEPANYRLKAVERHVHKTDEPVEKITLKGLSPVHGFTQNPS
jgi:hypothetical protein